MSRKNNALLAALVTASGMTAAMGAPIVEGLVNDKTLEGVMIFETDARTGRAMLVCTIGGVNRPVTNSAGDVRIYASTQAAFQVVKRNSTVGGEGVVAVVPAEKVSVIGDPVKALISRHKSMKAEDTKAGTAKTGIDDKIAAAAALGWDTAVGTPEADEYADLVARQTAVGEWKTFTAAALVTLTASLVAAGVDPVTYLSA